MDSGQLRPCEENFKRSWSLVTSSENEQIDALCFLAEEILPMEAGKENL
jgi:hypothetical protein